nr:hypothetical protein [Alkalisalibacterium limincola]
MLVGHPGHHPGIGVHVRRGDVPARAHEAVERLHIGAREALELGPAEVVGIDANRALASTKGDIDQRALAGHPECERHDLAQGSGRMEPDAALGRPQCIVVAATPRLEALQPAIVAAHLQADRQRFLGIMQVCEHLGVDVDAPGRVAQAPVCALEDVGLVLAPPCIAHRVTSCVRTFAQP